MPGVDLDAAAPVARTPGESRAFRGSFLHFVADPRESGQAARYLEDGLMLVRDGKVAGLGDARAILGTLPPGTAIDDYSGKLIVPGFVDTHVHYSQTDMIASDGEQLLAWLERWTYPAERGFEDAGHAGEVAEFFVEELLKNGTTTAMVFATVHPQSVEAIFESAGRRDMRLLSGKVMMDRNCPEYLCDTAESGYSQSRSLIAKWHGRGRLSYAVTPRFAATSSEAQLEAAGALLREFPDVYLQSHVAENRGEVAWVAQLFPDSRSYLDVYDRFGLLRERAIYAHCIWLDQADRVRAAESGTAMSFCPTSNLFLGSGLFDLDAARSAGARVGLGTDVGGGTSFSMLQTLNEAYKVAQMSGQRLTPLDAFHMATLGGARSLYLDHAIGNFEPGKEADFVVLDPEATPLLARRMRRCEDFSERLFAFMMLGDDRAVASTYVLGRRAYARV